MVKNKNGGKKTKKGSSKDEYTSNYINYREVGQDYAIITKKEGNCNFRCNIVSVYNQAEVDDFISERNRKEKEGSKRRAALGEQYGDNAETEHKSKITDIQVGDPKGIGEILGHVRGTMKKKRMWVDKGDLVLVSIRDFEKTPKCDIMEKYNSSQMEKLKQKGEIITNTAKRDQDIEFSNELELAEEDELEFDVDDI